jgi:hypothetical protein
MSEGKGRKRAKRHLGKAPFTAEPRQDTPPQVKLTRQPRGRRRVPPAPTPAEPAIAPAGEPPAPPRNEAADMLGNLLRQLARCDNPRVARWAAKLLEGDSAGES